VTVPEIEEIRGVDCGGVIHTLLEKKLVVTAGRKNVVGRPILYRTSREFLVHFGLKDTNELPSLKEFEELARQALGSDLPTEQEQQGTFPEAEPLPIGGEEPVTDNGEAAETVEVIDQDPIAGENEPADAITVAGQESTFENNEADEEATPPDEPKP